jgi:polyferredoxin
MPVILRKRLKDPTTRMRVGLSFLVLAILTRRFLHPGAVLSPNALDLATGLFYGLAIGFLLLSLLAGRSGRSTSC